MKIVCISDTHGDHAKIDVPIGDILIHAGDFSSCGHSNDTKDFLKWFNKLPHRHKVLIAGNHDAYPYAHFYAFREMLKQYAPSVIYLENEGTTIEGLRFWGSPITPTFLKWFFMADRGSDIRRFWDMIPSETDVLVTHGPPFGFLDKSNAWNEILGKKFDDCLGCQDLLDAVQRVRPKLHIFGHIHGSGGRMEYNFYDYPDQTTFVNASVMDENYMPAHKPITVEL